MRSLLSQLDIFIAQLNAQTDDIITATENLNSLVGQVAAQRRDSSTRHSPRFLRRWRCWRIPARRWPNAVDALGKFSAIATTRSTRPRNRSSPTCATSAPVLRELANAGPALTKGLDFLSTYPWVKSTVPNWFRGDFANITLVIDLTLSRLDAGLFTGTRWEGDLTELEMQWGRTIGQMPSPYTAGNPLIAPYRWGAY